MDFLPSADNFQADLVAFSARIGAFEPELSNWLVAQPARGPRRFIACLQRRFGDQSNHLASETESNGGQGRGSYRVGIGLMTERVDCIVIGAGVVGLAVAARLAAEGAEVVVLERHGLIGSETSARNSEVIRGDLLSLWQPEGSTVRTR